MSELERIEDVIYDVAVDHAMWIGDDGQPLNYLPEREARIGDFIKQAADAIRAHLAEVAADPTVREEVRMAVCGNLGEPATANQAHTQPREAAMSDAAVGTYLRAIGGGK